MTVAVVRRRMGSPFRGCLRTAAYAACAGKDNPERLVAAKNGVRVDWLTLPPLAFRRQAEDGEMQVRRLGRRVARAPDVSDQVPSRNVLSFVQPIGVSVEMGVVV